MYIYIKFIREATESAQPDWELNVQQRSYFVLYIYIDHFCFDVFEKSISRTEMIGHSFES